MSTSPHADDPVALARSIATTQGWDARGINLDAYGRAASAAMGKNQALPSPNRYRLDDAPSLAVLPPLVTGHPEPVSPDADDVPGLVMPRNVTEVLLLHHAGHIGKREVRRYLGLPDRWWHWRPWQ